MAEIEIGSLLVKLRADLSSLQGDVRKMEQTFQGGFNNVQTKAIAFGRSVAASLGISIGVGAFAAFIKGTINAADAITDLADISGLSVRTLLGLEQITAKYGITVQEAATGVRFMLRSLVEAQDGTGKQAEALKRLGFSTEQMLGFMSDPDGFLKLFTERLAQIPTHAERVAIAQDLASRAGARLAPVLLDIAQNGLPQVSQETEEAYKALGRFADSLAVASVKAFQFFTTLLAGPSEVSKLGKAVEQFQKQLDQLQKPDDAIILWLERLVGRDRGKNIEDLQAKLRELRDSIDQLDAPRIEPGAPAGPPRGDPTKIDALRESLQKQVVALNAQKIALDQGDAAGLRYQLTQEAILQVGKNLPPEIKTLIDRIVSLSSAFDKLKVSREILASFAPVLADIDAAQDRAIAGGREFLQISRQLANDALDPLAKELAESDQKWDDLRKRLVDAAEAAGITGEALVALERRIAFLKEVSAVKIKVDLSDLDFAFDKKEAKDFNEALGEMQKRMSFLKDIADVLGNPFANLSDQISATREELQLLIRAGKDTTEVLGRLKNLEAVESLRVNLHGITESVTDGIKETIIGIQRGEQTLSEGLENMLRNSLIGLNAAIIDKTIFFPLKGIMNAFFDGFAESFAEAGDNAAQKMARNLGTSLGDSLKDVLSNLKLGGGGGGFNFDLSGIFGWVKGLFGFEQGGPVAKSLLRFAAGGEVPAILHEGEFVLRKSAVDSIGLDALRRMNRDFKLPKFEYGGYIPSSVFTVPQFQGGGPVGNLNGENQRPIAVHVQIAQDFTGAVAPSDLRTGRRETREYVLQEIAHNHAFRVALREATRK